MKTTEASGITPSKPGAVTRRADRSLLSTGGDSGFLLLLDRILTELAVRNFKRTAALAKSFQS